MKISKLIQLLSDIKTARGDLPVVVETTNSDDYGLYEPHQAFAFYLKPFDTNEVVILECKSRADE